MYVRSLFLIWENSYNWSELGAVNARVGGSSPSSPANNGELIRPGDGYYLENIGKVSIIGTAGDC